MATSASSTCAKSRQGKLVRYADEAPRGTSSEGCRLTRVWFNSCLEWTGTKSVRISARRGRAPQREGGWGDGRGQWKRPFEFLLFYKGLFPDRLLIQSGQVTAGGDTPNPGFILFRILHLQAAIKLKAILTGLTLLILPLAFVLATSYLKEARGPYWLGTNSDPDFMYLGGALSLSKLSSPAFADHPGTPVISLGALVIITAQAVQQKADLQEDVLKNPEFYLDIIYYTLLVLCAAMLVVAGGIAIG